MIEVGGYGSEREFAYQRHFADVLETGANDVYVISRGDGSKELLVPAIPDVIVETNLEDGFMTIRPLKGLFDDEN